MKQHTNDEMPHYVVVLSPEGSLAPTRADLLPPHKRFRDSYSSETSMEEDTKIGTTETEDGRELDIVDRDDARDHVEIDPRDIRDGTEEYEADTSAGDTVKVGIDSMSALVANEESKEPAGEDFSDSSGTRDGLFRSFEDMLIDLDDVVHYFYHYMSEVRIDRIFEIETVQRRLEADHFFIISSITVQTSGSGISSLRAVGTTFTSSGNLYYQWELSPGVGTTFTGSGNLYCQWELSPGSGKALCILFPTIPP
nr:hypothetical protein [Tanacetum cinerariifolium]